MSVFIISQGKEAMFQVFLLIRISRLQVMFYKCKPVRKQMELYEFNGVVGKMKVNQSKISHKDSWLNHG